MNKKTILVLLMPSVFFLTLAIFALVSATEMFPNRLYTQWVQYQSKEIVREVQNGQFRATPQKLAGMLGDSYHEQYKMQLSLAKTHNVQSKVIGFGLLVGVALQIFVIYKIRSKIPDIDV